jgi:hypothetical protein
MVAETDSFGPWTPPGQAGRPLGEATPTSTEPTDTTSVVVSEEQFWESSTQGIAECAAPGAWARCKLGPYELPGQVQIQVSPPKAQLDIKPASGKGGAKITRKGWEPAKVTISVLLMTPAHLAVWREIEGKIAPEIETKGEPLDIESPVLGSRIKSVVIEDVGFLEPGPKPGTRQATIHAVQWVAKPKTTGATTSTSSQATREPKEAQEERYWDAALQWSQHRAEGGQTPWSTWAESWGLPPDAVEPPSNLL